MYDDDAATDGPSIRPSTPEDALGLMLLVAVLVIMSLGVFYRYVLNDSLSWPEEAARYGLGYIVFIGLITGVRRGTHIRIDLLDAHLPPALRRALALLLDAVCLVFFVYMAWLAFELCQILHRSRSAAMGMPLSYAYGALVVGFAGAALRLGWQMVANARRTLRGGA